VPFNKKHRLKPVVKKLEAVVVVAGKFQIMLLMRLEMNIM
jgi:hypothetical protein